MAYNNARNIHTPWLGALALALALASASPAAAQQPTVGGPITVEPTDAQIKLYDAAGEAYQRGDYRGAVELLRSSLALGELNIIYVNLGRALFKLDQCSEAMAVYEKALTAPTMESPTPAQIAEKIDEYKADMKKECSGTLVVVCEPSSIQITLNDGKPQVCTGDPITLKPGVHKLKGTLQGQDALKAVTISSMQTSTETIAIKVPDVVAPPVVTPKSETSIWPWITVGTGGAILAGAAVLDAVVLGDDIDTFKTAAGNGDANADTLKSDAQSLQTTVLITYVVGALVTTGGLVWAFMDAPESASASSSAERVDEDAIETSVDGWLDGDTAGVQWKMTW